MEENFVGDSGAAAAFSACPQPPQNFSLGSFENPQEGQVRDNDAPHSAQKSRPSGYRSDTEDISCCDLHQPEMIADCLNLSGDSIRRGAMMSTWDHTNFQARLDMAALRLN